MYKTYFFFLSMFQTDSFLHHFFTLSFNFILLQLCALNLSSWNNGDFWTLVVLLIYSLPFSCSKLQFLMQRIKGSGIKELKYFMGEIDLCNVYLVILQGLYQVLHLGDRLSGNKFGPEASQVEPRHKSWAQGFLRISCGLFPCPW